MLNEETNLKRVSTIILKTLKAKTVNPQKLYMQQK